MRALVLSDLHSNLEALQTALDFARNLGFDRLLVLGDIVGYGADPNAVIDLLRAERNVTAVRGNHDRVAGGIGEPDDFNHAARVSAEWTRAELSPSSRAYLAALPQGPVSFAPGRLLAHGSPIDEDLYLLETRSARRCFESLPFDLCLFGHSHLPGSFVYDGEGVRLMIARSERSVLPLAAGARHLVNPGSLGQPRDRDPRCSFAIYDDADATVTVYRREYPLERTRDKILAAGLPRSLGDRLLIGA